MKNAYISAPPCQATRYWVNKEKPLNKVQPYNCDNTNEWIFGDGSRIRFSIDGKPEFIPPDHEVLNVEGQEAFQRGVCDRLARRKFDSSYKTHSRQFLPAIKYQYACGWFSIPNWPRKARS